MARGIFKRDKLGRIILEDFTGKTFGRLTVIKRDYDYPTKGTYWICRCVCGTEKSINASRLKEGTTVSCGCYAREVQKTRRRGRAPDEAAIRLTLGVYRKNALKRGHVWNLPTMIATLLLLSNCQYCGSAPSRKVAEKGRTSNSKHSDIRLNGIDRFDNQKGYTIENSIACCQTCNFAKRNLPPEFWINYLDQITTYRSKLKDSK